MLGLSFGKLSLGQQSWRHKKDVLLFQKRRDFRRQLDLQLKHSKNVSRPVAVSHCQELT